MELCSDGKIALSETAWIAPRGYFRFAILRGRKAVRAQSTISHKSNPKPLLLLSITVFLVRMVFIRTKNTVGARERAMAALGMRRNLRRRNYVAT